MKNKTYYAMLELRGNPESWVFAYGSYDRSDVEAAAVFTSDNGYPFQIIPAGIEPSPKQIEAIVVLANEELYKEQPRRTFNINIAFVDDLGKESYTSKVVKEEVSIDDLIIGVITIENNPDLNYDFIVIDINP